MVFSIRCYSATPPKKTLYLAPIKYGRHGRLHLSEHLKRSKVREHVFTPIRSPSPFEALDSTVTIVPVETLIPFSECTTKNSRRISLTKYSLNPSTNANPALEDLDALMNTIKVHEALIAQIQYFKIIFMDYPTL